MRKYDVRICSCGRIHMVNKSKVDAALENDKNLLLICASCGKATVIGANKEPDYYNPSEECYIMYQCDFSAYYDCIISTNDFESSEENKGIDQIIYSHGIKVPMMTGNYATDYYNGTFYDYRCPALYEIERLGTGEEVLQFINKYKNDRTKVNMNRFIGGLPDDILEELSKHWIDGLNWKGTKWETEYNSN